VALGRSLEVSHGRQQRVQLRRPKRSIETGALSGTFTCMPGLMSSDMRRWDIHIFIYVIFGKGTIVERETRLPTALYHEDDNTNEYSERSMAMLCCAEGLVKLFLVKEVPFRT
jgi:hypothetical protein